MGHQPECLGVGVGRWHGEGCSSQTAARVSQVKRWRHCRGRPSQTAPALMGSVAFSGLSTYSRNLHQERGGNRSWVMNCLVPDTGDLQERGCELDEGERSKSCCTLLSRSFTETWCLRNTRTSFPCGISFPNRYKSSSQKMWKTKADREKESPKDLARFRDCS